MNNALFFLKQAVAELLKKPGFVFSSVITMSLTMGAMIAVLTLCYFMIYKPLPYPEQELLTNVEYRLFNGKNEHAATGYPYPAAEELYKNNKLFSKAALLTYDLEVANSDPSHSMVRTTYTTPELFELLAAPMLLGRSFSGDEGLISHHPVAVLSYQAWRDLFNSRMDILNQTITVSSVDYRIIGVTDEGFSPPDFSKLSSGMSPADVWLPWDFNHLGRDNWGAASTRIALVGKLKPGTNSVEVSQLLTPAANQLFIDNNSDKEFFSGWRVDINVKPLRKAILGNSDQILYLLLIGVSGLLTIAVTNITNLFMAHTAERSRQFAICAALGAKKSQLRSIFLSEASLIIILAGILGLLVAAVGFELMQSYFAKQLPRVNELHLNFVSVISAIVLGIFIVYIFSYFCLSIINYRRLNLSLQASGKGTGVQVSEKVRFSLMSSQVAIAGVLVFCNLALLKNALDNIQVPLGFNEERLISMELNYTGQQQSWDFYVPLFQEVERTLQQLPQIESTTLSGSPLGNFGTWAATDIDTNQRYLVFGKEIDEKYFNFIELPLVAGNTFTKEQLNSNSSQVIVNATLARALTPDANVIGRRLDLGAGPLTIVGVVQDVFMPGSSHAVNRVYRPIDRANYLITLKLKKDQKITRKEIVNTLKKVNSVLVAGSVELASDVRDRALFPHYATATVAALLAALTILLASLGLYGVLSYATQMRWVEFGIRRSIGAKNRYLVWQVITDNLEAFGVGLLISIFILIAIYLGFSSEISAILSWGLLPLGMLTILFLSFIVMLACYIPLRPILQLPIVLSLRGSVSDHRYGAR